MLHYRQSNDYTGLVEVAPVLFGAALVSRMNSLGVRPRQSPVASALTRVSITQEP
jgi:hypothetical protein